jgi:PAS domain S-box-containing protein
LQGNSIEILYILLFGTLILLLFAVGYALLTAYSRRRIIAAERSKLEEVSKSEKKYRGLFDNSLAGIIRFYIGSWQVIDANEAACIMLGGATKESLQTAIERFPAKTMTLVTRLLSQEGYVGQTEIHTVNASGEDLWILFAAKRLEQDDVAQAFLIDITERKRYEEKNKEQSALLDQAQDAFIVTNSQGEVESWNAGAVGLYGWSEAEVVGKPISQLVYRNGDREQFQTALDDVIQLHAWHGEHLHRRKDNKTVLVEGRWKTINTVQNNERIILMVNRDITEKRRLEAQSQRAQRAESIALLAGGLAHDLQNILAPVRMSARFLKNKVSGKSSQAVVKALEERAKSGLLLVKDILAYGKGTAIRQNRLDIKKIVNEVAATMMRRSKKRIEVKCSFDGQNSSVIGDASQLKQVLLNLCLNAQDAMTKGGVLDIQASDILHDRRLIESYPNVPEGPYVVVNVRDSGEGIPEEDLERIFEPFYTTKEQKGGTGLGLAIARAIISKHNGYITVDSALGKGTTFSVYLPAIKRDQK